MTSTSAQVQQVMTWLSTHSLVQRSRQRHRSRRQLTRTATATIVSTMVKLKPSPSPLKQLPQQVQRPSSLQAPSSLKRQELQRRSPAHRHLRQWQTGLQMRLFLTNLDSFRKHYLTQKIPQIKPAGIFCVLLLRIYTNVSHPWADESKGGNLSDYCFHRAEDPG